MVLTHAVRVTLARNASLNVIVTKGRDVIKTLAYATVECVLMDGVETTVNKGM